MTLLELAEKAGVKFHRCDAAWGGTWGWSIDESCKFNGSGSQEAACESWARTTFGAGTYEAVKSLLAENAKLKVDATTIRRRRINKNALVRTMVRNDTSRTTATKHRSPWSEQDLRALFDADMTVDALAKKLGRSYQAIVAARMRYHHTAPEGWVAKSTPAKAVQEDE